MPSAHTDEAWPEAWAIQHTVPSEGSFFTVLKHDGDAMGLRFARYYELHVSDGRVFVRYGRVNQRPYCITTAHDDNPTALQHAGELLEHRLGKGYAPASSVLSEAYKSAQQALVTPRPLLGKRSLASIDDDPPAKRRATATATATSTSSTSTSSSSSSTSTSSSSTSTSSSSTSSSSTTSTTSTTSTSSSSTSRSRTKPAKREGAAPLSGMCFCITGTLSMVRRAFWDLLTKNGATYTNTVTPAVTHLIVGMDGDDTDKRRRADERGIPSVSEEWVMELVDGARGSDHADDADDADRGSRHQAASIDDPVDDDQDKEADDDDDDDGDDGDGSSGEAIQIGSTTYIRLPTGSAPATFDELLSRYGRGGAAGNGYYLVGRKKEKISSGKQMVIIDKKDATKAYDNPAKIKEILGLTGQSYQFNNTISSKYDVYVQSLSSNRNLLPGATFLVRS